MVRHTLTYTAGLQQWGIDATREYFRTVRWPYRAVYPWRAWFRNLSCEHLDTLVNHKESDRDRTRGGKWGAGPQARAYTMQ